METRLWALGDRCGALLRRRGDTVAICEATSAGLINAALQGGPRASSYLAGSLTIYSAHAGKALVPREVRVQLGGKENYRTAEIYRESKKTFALVMARHARERFGADWGVAESGATDTAGLPAQLKPAGVFTAVAVVGPNDVERCVLVDVKSDGGAHARREAMSAFGTGALQLLESVLAEDSGTAARL